MRANTHFQLNTWPLDPAPAIRTPLAEVHSPELAEPQEAPAEPCDLEPLAPSDPHRAPAPTTGTSVCSEPEEPKVPATVPLPNAAHEPRCPTPQSTLHSFPHAPSLPPPAAPLAETQSLQLDESQRSPPPANLRPPDTADLSESAPETPPHRLGDEPAPTPEVATTPTVGIPSAPPPEVLARTGTPDNEALPRSEAGPSNLPEPATVETPRPARPYRPRLRPRPQEPLPTQPATRQPRRPDAPAGTLDAELVLAFRPGGWGIQLSALFRRTAAMAEDLPIRFGCDAYELCAIGTDFYEPVALQDPSAALADGIAAETTANGGARWARGGRTLHAYTGKAGVAGFVSAARVVIGEENAVLCTAEIAESMQQACAAAGSPQPAEILGPGIPSGWRCFRGIRPTFAAAPPTCDEALLALVPHPDAAIELDGGIAMTRSTWLAGHPPSIRILGAAPGPNEVTIDGRPAACSREGEWAAPGWDAEGAHAISYAGLSRRYDIAPAPTSWERWNAHTSGGLSLCGALASTPAGLPAFAAPGRLSLACRQRARRDQAGALLPGHTGCRGRARLRAYLGSDLAHRPGPPPAYRRAHRSSGAAPARRPPNAEERGAQLVPRTPHRRKRPRLLAAS